MESEIGTIVSAIEFEAKLSSKPLDWNIHKAERHGKIWKVFVEPAEFNAQLDESLEGAAAWWPEPTNGSGDVLSVVPEDLQINLRYATSSVPGSGRMKIYPIRYLEKLAEAWSSPFRGPRFYRAFEELQVNAPAREFVAPSPKWFEELRAAQRSAFDLLGYRLSFLWGPPGTGKTHTLGAMLASFLVENPTARVLLLSTTNTAVDLALVSVDKALERLSRHVLDAANCRKECKRIGSHFVAHHYKDRQHLIPGTNEALIQRLAAAEASRPEAGDVAQYDLWKCEQEEMRSEMRAQTKDVLQANRLTSMTCTRGMFSYSDLENIGSFDLVVFDEASQVGLVHALPFLPLAKRVLFAGDHQQLAPIVVAEDREVRKWMGRSAFEFMRRDRSNTTTLTEQSRMGAEICRVVGQTFYDGVLKVCPKAAADVAWKAERTLHDIPILSAKPLSCLEVSTNGGFHAGFRGYVRDESAERIVAAVRAAVRESKPTEIAILTPYRAQRTVIRKKLRDAGIIGVQVSTVHRAQGSEKRTIFFDPVLGTHQALTDRLINVALSRAKARLVVTLSKGDLANPKLAKIRALIDDRVHNGATFLGTFLRSRIDPESVGKANVWYQGTRYIFLGFDSSGDNLLLKGCSGGPSRKFRLDVILARTAEESSLYR